MDNTGNKTITVEYGQPMGTVSCCAAASDITGNKFTVGSWGTKNGTQMTVTVAPASNQSWIYLSCAIQGYGTISQISYNQ
jgi:hypothetical protein